MAHVVEDPLYCIFYINNLNCWTLGARSGEGCTEGKSGKSNTTEARPLLISLTLICFVLHTELSNFSN